MRIALGLVFATGAAFAFSFSIDLLFGVWVGVYDSSAYLPVVTWSVLATVVVAGAYKVAGASRWLALPFGAFGCLALFGALIGPHPHNYGVAALLFVQGFIVWRVSTGGGGGFAKKA